MPADQAATPLAHHKDSTQPIDTTGSIESAPNSTSASLEAQEQARRAPDWAQEEEQGTRDTQAKKTSDILRSTLAEDSWQTTEDPATTPEVLGSEVTLVGTNPVGYPEGTLVIQTPALPPSLEEEYSRLFELAALGYIDLPSDSTVSTEPETESSLESSGSSLFGSDSEDSVEPEEVYSGTAFDPFADLSSTESGTCNLYVKWTEPGIKQCLKREGIPLTSELRKVARPSILRHGRFYFGQH